MVSVHNMADGATPVENAAVVEAESVGEGLHHLREDLDHLPDVRDPLTEDHDRFLGKDWNIDRGGHRQ